MPLKRKAAARKTQPKITAIDLFCGVGGLTRGLERAAVDVRLGVDIDPHCAYPFEANNSAKFLLKSVDEIGGDELAKHLDRSGYTLLAGCAPCQPFSKYSQGRASKEDSRWKLLEHFGRLVTELKPDLVTMENVEGLASRDVFISFVSLLEDADYEVSYSVVNCADYGIAQTRRRLVLLASRLGKIELLPPTHLKGKRRTVRHVIGKLPPVKAGADNAGDPLHVAASLSPINLSRMRSSKPGGSWRDWAPSLVTGCHRKSSGRKYSSVYGRMEWDGPAPTMTTQYYNFGSGRFGHPEQDRALTLREGAIIQSFPPSYKFVRRGDAVYTTILGRMIGNAVPVRLGEVIGMSLVQHVERHQHGNDRASEAREKQLAR